MIRYLAEMMGMVKNEDGQGMVEYALIIGGIAIIALVGINVLGPQLSTMFTTISGNL
jgi:pilus assembly protein Flp/PilA